MSRIMLLGFLIMGLSASALMAQDLGSIVGAVTDPSGAVVPGVSITATNESTSVTRTTVTNAAGAYTLAALPVAVYTIQAKKTGFVAYAQSGITVNVGSIVRIDVTLKLGSVTQQITVKAQALHLQTESGSVSSVITGQQVAQIAINGRNFLQLATLVPGATSELPSFNNPVGVTANASIAFNGERPSHNVWFVDGQENYDRGCGGCITILPAEDAIQEFRVETSNMDVTTGFGSGGQIQVELKSGTKRFHGEAYEFLRNDALDATSFFANKSGTQKPPLKYNNFGYNLGGPFYIPGHYNTQKNKTFFFWSQDWRRLRQGSTIFAAAAPAAWRNGDFSSYGSPILDHSQPVTLPDGTTGYMPYANNKILPGSLDPNAEILAVPNILPLPNTPDGKFFAASPSVPTNVREDILRVDQHFNEKTSLMFHYVRDSVLQQFPTTLWSGDTYPTVGTQFINPPISLVLRLTRTISPTMLNEVMVAYQRQPLTLEPSGTYTQPSNLTIPEVYPGNTDKRIPTLGLSGPALGVTYDVGSQPWHNVSNTWTFRDGLTKVIGNHTLKLGGEWLRFLKEQDLFGQTQGNFTFNGSATAGSYLGSDGQIHQTSGNEFADFMLGQAFSYGELRLQTSPAYITNNYGLWLGDAWKARTGFTLTYGLRWEAMPHAYEIHNQVAVFRPSLYDPSQAPQLNSDGTIVPGTGNLLNGMAIAGKSGISRGLVDNHWGLLEPRFGIAWQPFGDNKTVIRGGYGIFYERIQGNDIYNVATNPPFSGSASIFSTELSNPGGGSSVLHPVNTQNYDPRYLQPYSQEYSFGVQRQLNPQTILGVMYVGSKGTDEQINRNINQPLAPVGSAAVNTLRPYPGYGNIDWYQNSTSSNYNSLQVSLRMTNWHGLSSGVAYTWSHSIDFGSGDVPGVIQNAYNVGAERGNSNYDLRHNLIINYIYDLPIARNATGLTKQAFGGWELAGITSFTSGLPVTVSFPGDPAQVGGSSYRANLIGNPNSGSGIHTADLWFNPNAFAAVPTGSFGNEARNVVWGAGVNNWDISLYKNFTAIPLPGTAEGARVEFRAEFYNAFNHTQFNGYFTSFGAVGFGGASSARDPRTIQIGLKLMF